MLTNAVVNLANSCECRMNETTTQRVLANVFSLLLVCQHPLSELLVSKSQVVILHHAQGGRRKGGGGRGRS